MWPRENRLNRFKVHFHYRLHLLPNRGSTGRREGRCSEKRMVEVRDTFGRPSPFATFHWLGVRRCVVSCWRPWPSSRILKAAKSDCPPPLQHPRRTCVYVDDDGGDGVSIPSPASDENVAHWCWQLDFHWCGAPHHHFRFPDPITNSVNSSPPSSLQTVFMLILEEGERNRFLTTREKKNNNMKTFDRKQDISKGKKVKWN